MRKFGILLGAVMLMFTGYLMAGIPDQDIIDFCFNYGGSWRCY